MTQNPYQQYPPMPPGQGYPPVQPPPYGTPPPGPQGPPPGYGQQWPPPPGVPQGGVPEPGAPTPFTQPGQAGPPSADPFGNPGVPTGGGGDQPGMHQLENRLLLIRPTSFNPTAPPHPSAHNGRPGPLVMAELIVCDGDPIAGNVNGDTDQFTPFAAGPKVVPFYCGSMYIRGAVLPGQLEQYVAGRGFCLGRMVKGTSGKTGKPPWVLADPTEADKVIGRQIHARWEEIKAAGQAPMPDQFGSPQGQAAPTGNGFAPQPQHAYGQQGPPPGYGQPQGYPQQPYPPY